MSEERHYGYGFFPGGDPRRFDPDREDNDEGVAAWEEACKKWNAAEQSNARLADAPGSCQAIPGIGFITLSGFGPGSYWWPCPGPECDWCGGEGEKPLDPEWDAEIEPDPEDCPW